MDAMTEVEVLIGPTDAQILHFAAFGHSIAIKTINRWADEGRFGVIVRTPGGHRRFKRDKVVEYFDSLLNNGNA